MQQTWTEVVQAHAERGTRRARRRQDPANLIRDILTEIIDETHFVILKSHSREDAVVASAVLPMRRRGRRSKCASLQQRRRALPSFVRLSKNRTAS